MATRKYSNGTRPAFLLGTPQQNSGRTVDWAKVSDHFNIGSKKVYSVGAVLANATSMSLAALQDGAKVKPGDVIRFTSGTTITVGAVSANGLSVGIRSGTTVAITAAPAALAAGEIGYIIGSGPKFIPAGTIMAQASSQDNSPGMMPYLSVRNNAAATAAALAGNVGNGTIGTVTVKAAAEAGTYTVRFIEPATNLGTFVVSDPKGLEIGRGVAGTAFDSTDLGFTIADGSTDWSAGDGFSILVYEQNLVSSTYNVVPCGLILTDAAEGSVSDSASGYGVAVGGTIFENFLPDVGITNVLAADFKEFLCTLPQLFTFEVYHDTRGA
jgi:hypothetical protein